MSSSEFETRLAWHSALLYPPRREALRRLCEIAGEPPAVLVELCSGSGEYVAALSAKGYDCRGVEPRRELHNEAQRLHPELAGPQYSTQSTSIGVLGSARLIHGEATEVFDLLRPPLALAFCLHGRLADLGSLAELADVMLQLSDLTRPAGKLLLSLPNFEHILERASPADGELRFELPGRTAMREDGRLIEYERCYRIDAGRESEGPKSPPLTAELDETLRLPEGLFTRRGRRLVLTRERLSEAFPPGLSAEWLGDWDGRGWSSACERTIAVLS